MTTMPAEANFSELIQRPKDTVARMQVSARKGLRLHRRDAEDLYLTTAARAAQAVEVVDSTTRMFVALLKESPAAVDLLTRVVPEAFPWVRFLPDGAVREFLVEFVETARASTDLGTIEPISQVIAEWKHTAEIYADPELYAALTADHGDVDLGDVPAPEVAGE
ncbi:hypothetical protein [Streptomyces sp. XY152]|uniref:hypothetical protein n=1 Tax=Streptomyces sp. XY152 TaxID=1415560 RepID=UPI0006B06D3F|nr:hypothetical protein [Streptomyces sp. XY152]KOV19780.1 hypothetical protein ADK58_35240 [Streptomyces sp. XY152]